MAFGNRNPYLFSFFLSFSLHFSPYSQLFRLRCRVCCCCWGTVGLFFFRLHLLPHLPFKRNRKNKRYGDTGGYIYPYLTQQSNPSIQIQSKFDPISSVSKRPPELRCFALLVAFFRWSYLNLTLPCLSLPLLLLLRALGEGGRF